MSSEASAAAPDVEPDDADPDAHEGPLRILYLSIEERPDGFVWRIRTHLETAPVAVGRSVHPTLELARRDGVRTLDRICAQFRRHEARRDAHMIG